jgi:GTP cyclohydrolase I
MSLDLEKIDKKLGLKVNEFLRLKGVQTPTIFNETAENLKIKEISAHFSEIMKLIGLDLTDDSLAETPKRVAKMYINEIFWGLDYSHFPKCTTVANKMNYDEMVIEKNINVQSYCEHHFVIFSGKAHVSYFPKNKVLGLSKLNRIVEYFSRRPQIQERLTEQLFFALNFILETEDIAVVVSAEHFCVKSRGVEDIGSNTISSKMGGKFKTNSNTRNEFLSYIKSSM